MSLIKWSSSYGIFFLEIKKEEIGGGWKKDDGSEGGQQGEGKRRGARSRGRRGRERRNEQMKEKKKNSKKRNLSKEREQ